MKPLVIDGPRMSDISEIHESLLLKEHLTARFQENRRILGVHLWTHSPCRLVRNPVLVSLLQQLREREIPAAFQVTVTGLGGTPAEPGIETTKEAFDSLHLLFRKGLLLPERTCLRIDPIQAWEGPFGILTNLHKIEPLLLQAGGLGIRRFRISLMDFQRYRRKILPRSLSRNLKNIPVSPAESGKILCKAVQAGVDIRTCATDLSREGVPPGSCFDFPWITGLPLQDPLDPVASRKGCLCFVPKDVRLWKIPRRSSCSGGCLACYAQEHG